MFPYNHTLYMYLAVMKEGKKGRKEWKNEKNNNNQMQEWMNEWNNIYKINVSRVAHNIISATRLVSRGALHNLKSTCKYTTQYNHVLI